MKTYRIGRNILACLTAATVVLLLSQVSTRPAAAKNSWLEKGQQLLQQQTGDEPASGSAGAAAMGTLSNNDLVSGLKEALLVGSENVVKQLGAVDGFNNDPAIHIPLPASLEKVRKVLAKAGMAGMVDDLELKLNRAAEKATPKAKELFAKSIREMSIEDAKKIYQGPDDAATRYFREKMSGQLATEMKPVVQESLAEVGAIKAYDAVMAKYKSIPLVPDVKANLTEDVVNKSMDGIFYYLAKEEKAIRENPAKRTTELLQKVFGHR